MKKILTTLLCGAMAASMTTSITAPASAQSYYDRGDARYQADQRYYEQQMREYNRARDQYERDRAAYDRRYGYGAYARYYGEFNRPYPTQPYYADASASVPDSSACAQANADAKSGRAAGTIIGALIGGAIGSNVAASGHRDSGTLLGAVVGGAIGNKAGGNTNAGRYAALCDNNGYYFSYDQTYPYREGRNGVPRGQYSSRYYADRNCRLAPAQTDTGEYRYIRVCPDANGRYRVAA